LRFPIALTAVALIVTALSAHAQVPSGIGGPSSGGPSSGGPSIGGPSRGSTTNSGTLPPSFNPAQTPPVNNPSQSPLIEGQQTSSPLNVLNVFQFPSSSPLPILPRVELVEPRSLDFNASCVASICGGDRTAPVNPPRNSNDENQLKEKGYLSPGDLRVSRIKRGNGAIDPASYAFAVHLTVGTRPCSGVLLDRNRLLTAFHCACDADTFKSGELVIGIGSERVAIEDRGFNLLIRPNSVRVHYFNNASFDQCLMATRERLIVQPDVVILTGISVPETIPDRFFLSKIESIDRHKEQIIVGFGESSPNDRGGSKRSGVVRLEACDGNDCSKDYEIIAPPPQQGLTVTNCYGDSGGPVVVYNVERKEFGLVGITSRNRGGSYRASCASGGIFAKLFNDSIKSWIESVR
jgi:hypothetical protein